MTKQEEIRETIWKFLADYKKDNGNPAVDWAFILQHRLAEKGVVIKVDKELPINRYPQPSDKYDDKQMDLYIAYELAQKDMAGYVAVQPLIKEQ